MSETSRKNAIWIFGDQHRAQALSCNGDPNVNTPELDRMVAEGQNWSRAVSGFPLCCPFRGSLLTSRYPHECVPGHEYQMPPEMPTVANAFKDAGFHTAYFGKWHLDGCKEDGTGNAGIHIIPPERRGGFDTWLGYDNNNSQYDCHVCGGDGDETRQERLEGYETDALTDYLVAYIRKMGEARRTGEEKNFFAVLSVQPPHNPYVAPLEYMARHNPAQLQLRPNVPAIPRIEDKCRRDLAGYYAMIENLDWNVGRVRRALAEEGLDHDTHIIFFSDHGDMHGSHGQTHKTSPWEESIRIPFIIGGLRPRYEAKAGNVPVLLNHVDIAPTTLGLCGVETPEWMRGTDYSGWRLKNKPRAEAPDSVFIQSVIPTGHGHSIDRPWRAIITNDNWKYVVLENQPWMMFNLNEDPYELVNLAFNSIHRERRKKMNDRLQRWIDETGDEFSLPEV